jgi:signal peptide peptidase SppA
MKEGLAMELQRERLKLISRSPLWAIRPEGLQALLMRLASGAPIGLPKPQTKGSAGNKVAIIPVQGVLTRDEAWAGTTYGSISDAAEKAASDPSVKRIVLDVDSPGGEVTGLPETAAILSQAAKVKPVHAIVDGYAASAAYWLTSQASYITMAPSAEVGSVGVRMMHVDISEALEDAGIKVTELSSGKFKTEWSPYTPPTKAATADMQAKLTTAHNDFIRAVRDGRGMRTTPGITKDRYGEGRMFTAKEALGHGLADAVQSSREFYKALTAPETTPGTARARLELERQRV